MNLMSLSRKIIVLITLVMPVSLLAETLIMTAPPREAPAEATAMYEGLAMYLSDATGRNIVYKHPGDWLTYQRNMRNDKYDIIFDGPHFTSWRVKRIDYNVQVRLPNNLEFVLVVKKNNKNINTTKDLVTKYVCGVNPPHLSTLSVLGLYPNPIQQPRLVGIKGHMNKVLDGLKQNKCEGAIFVTHFYEKHKDKLKVIARTQPLPDQAISTSNRLNSTEQEKLKRALLSSASKPYVEGLMKKYGGGASSFISASNADYNDYNKLIEGQIVGW